MAAEEGAEYFFSSFLTSITGEEYISGISIGKEERVEKDNHPIGGSCFRRDLDSCGTLEGAAGTAKFQGQSPG
jgi:hypothetical protein